MVEKEVTLKILADVDDSQVEDLENVLQQIVDGKITIPVETDSTELEEVESRIEELEQKRADIYMGMDDTELEEVEAELDELEAKQIELTATVDSSGINETSQDLDNLEQSADNAGAALEAMANLDIANTLSQWGSQAESYAQELDNIAISTEQLAIQTGMTDSQMTGMLNNITNATFPREEALMYVQSLDQIGVASENLGASATGLDKINDAFHMGAPAVNTLGQELSVLGVDMNNVSSSYNALAYANANTVGGMENFSKFLTRYDSQFHELGMNVDQAAVAIAAATHKFGGGRAALTGMSEALKNANGDLSVLEQELGLEAGALTNASQKTAQYSGQLEQMAAKEGQHKTVVQQLAAALDDVAASCNGALAPFASFLGLIGNAGSFAVGINGIVQLSNSILTLLGIKKAENAEEEVSIGLKIRSAAASAYHTVVETARTVATKAVAVAQAILNAVMAMNPIFLVIMAVVALIAILWYLYNTNESVRAAIDGFIQALIGVGEAIYGSLVGAFQWLTDTWNMVVNAFMTYAPLIAQVLFIMATGGIGAIVLLIAHMNGMPNQVGAILQNVIGRITGFVGSMVSNFVSGASSAVSGFMGYISSLPGRVAGELNAILQHAIQWGQNLINTLVNAARNAVSGILGAFQIASPGIIQRKLVLEFANTNERVGEITSGMATMLGENSRAMVRSWGSPSFDYSINGFAGNTKQEAQSTGANNNGQQPVNNLTFNLYGDMDTEERMKRFLDYVTEYLDWDNNTAGRNMEVL